MTDRIHSCRQSPNGRHRFTVSPLMCDYCARTTAYLTDMGWNAPAVDPDTFMAADAPYVHALATGQWKDEEADVNDARIIWRVVDTDNFGSDYPDEKFRGGEFTVEADAQTLADALNGDYDYNPRYYKVVRMPYELALGFEP